jgi:hypothetical protein
MQEAQHIRGKDHMNTLSVRLRYRPLRLGWCVSSDDFPALRDAIRINCTLWGGCFNPIIPVDDPELADALVRLYRVDALIPASSENSVSAFIERHKNLPWPFLGPELFIQKLNGEKGPVLVDISHPVAKMHNEFFKNNSNPESVVDLYEWDENDPLSDVFLCTYGAFPKIEDTGIDYHWLATYNLFGQRNIIRNNEEIQIPTLGRDCAASLGRSFIKRHHAVQNRWDRPGFYIGDADNFMDLVNFWNLRAADIGLVFIDPRYTERLKAKVTFFSHRIMNIPAGRFGPSRPAIWHRAEKPVGSELPLFGGGIFVCRVDTPLWNGDNVRAPIMYFDDSANLASIGESAGTTTISFSLGGKPFEEKLTNYDQHYVLSVDPGIGLYQNEHATLHAPFIPELGLKPNKFLVYSMYI